MNKNKIKSEWISKPTIAGHEHNYFIVRNLAIKILRNLEKQKIALKVKNYLENQK
jgi:hypothetical protein